MWPPFQVSTHSVGCICHLITWYIHFRGCLVPSEHCTLHSITWLQCWNGGVSGGVGHRNSHETPPFLNCNQASSCNVHLGLETDQLYICNSSLLNRKQTHYPCCHGYAHILLTWLYTQYLVAIVAHTTSCCRGYNVSVLCFACSCTSSTLDWPRSTETHGQRHTSRTEKTRTSRGLLATQVSMPIWVSSNRECAVCVCVHSCILSHIIAL